MTRNKGILYKPQVLIPADRFKLVTIYMNNSNLDMMFTVKGRINEMRRNEKNSVSCWDRGQ